MLLKVRSGELLDAPTVACIKVNALIRERSLQQDLQFFYSPGAVVDVHSSSRFFLSNPSSNQEAHRLLQVAGLLFLYMNYDLIVS